MFAVSRASLINRDSSPRHIARPTPLAHVRFVERREFSGDPADVWARVSDLGAIPSYWHGTKEFEVRVEGEKTKADVLFAFGGRGSAEVAVDEKRRTLVINFVRGPFNGTQTVAVADNVVEAVWDIDFNGAYRLLGPWEASHFRNGTRNALKRLCLGSSEI